MNADFPNVIQHLCELGGERLDIIAARVSGCTRSAIAKKIPRGEVLLDGSVCAAGTKVKAGQLLEIHMPAAQPSKLERQDIPLEIVYQDNDIAIVNKPQGMVVHPAPGNASGTLVNALLYHVQDLSGIGGELRPGIVHRIDKDTSGLLAIAKNARAHTALSAQLKTREMGRLYQALVIGCPREEQGTINAPIGRHKTERKRMAVTKDGREAITNYRLLERFSGYSLLELKLCTGRTHQIRVHLQHIHHPVAGDKVYGGKGTLGLTAQALHAAELHLVHPSSCLPMTFTAPLPPSFSAVLHKLRGQ